MTALWHHDCDYDYVRDFEAWLQTFLWFGVALKFAWLA